VRRAYQFRAFPTTGQTNKATACLRDHQRLYNAALEERRGRWKWNHEGVSYGVQSAQLKDIRTESVDQRRWSFSSQQATLKRLNKAFEAFYRRCKAGQTPGYPRFKAADRWDSVEWPSDGDGCRWKQDRQRVYLQGIGDVKVKAHRAVQGRVKTISLVREGRRWYVVLSCDDVPTNPLPGTGRDVGIDVGVARFATTSEGEIVANPRFARVTADELAAAQQSLSRKKQGSNNRRRARAVVAEVHRRTRNRRADFQHKTARAIVERYDTIALEDLRIRNMTRSASGTVEDQGTNVAAKSGLNRSILDAGWGQFANILVAKAEEAGRRIVFVDPRHTSITCHRCGARCTRPEQAVVICSTCGAFDADVNAAINIASRAGLGSGRAYAA
jgi:putative transposase